MADKKETKWCAIYTRKSTDENLDSGFTSLDAQKEYCEAFVKSREGEGWRVFPVEYNDPGFTGGNMDRPALKRLLMDAKQGKFHVVVCYKYDRLSRNTKDFLHILDIFDKHGAAFVSVTQPIDTTSSVGRLMRSILMDFAQFERELISERTKDKRAAMAKKGKWPGGYPVLGYDYNPETKSLDVNSKEAKMVGEMFETYLETKSLSAAAKILNAKGCRLKEWVAKSGNRKGGRRFIKTNLSYLLKNPIYIGTIRHGDQLYDGEHKAILDKDIFDRVQRQLVKNGEKNKSPNQDKHHFLLRGLVRCACCGSQMTPNFAYSKGKKYFYYKCVSVNKMNKDACKIGSAPARELEKLVIERLGFLGRSELVVKQIVERAQRNSVDKLGPKKQEKSLLAAELGKTEGEARNLVSVLAEKGAGSKKYRFIMDRLGELEEKAKELKAKIESNDQEVQELEQSRINADVIRHNLLTFSRVFNRLSPIKQRELTALLVQEIIYAPAVEEGTPHPALSLKGRGVRKEETKKEESKIKLTLRPLPDLGWEVDGDNVRFDERTNWLRGWDSNPQPTGYKCP
ncbi:MAG: recombinase family protein [Elusimicrobia bacterium]|nr:recombinase family protein [Elusimicrobiota bacterium]